MRVVIHIRQFGEQLEVRGEEGEASSGTKFLGDGGGQGGALGLDGGAAQLVDDEQRVLRHDLHEALHLLDLQHERGGAVVQVVAREDAGQDAVGHPEGRGLGRHEAADLRHHLQQQDLPDVHALARAVRACDYRDVLEFGRKLRAIALEFILNYIVLYFNGIVEYAGTERK